MDKAVKVNYCPDRSYQELRNRPGDTVLDIGPGEYPRDIATHFLDITDKFKDKLGGRPLTIGNVEDMPFDDNEFSYAVVSHVIEHTDHPDVAIAEVQRVARCGYIECPHVATDWFMQHGHVHGKWQVTLSGNTFVFTAISPEQNSYLMNVEFRNANWIVTQASQGFSPYELMMRKMFWESTPFLNPHAHWDENTRVNAVVVR
jgi:hypothetical protein